MAENRETFLRFVLRGVVIAAAAVVVFLVLVLLLLFYVLPEGWNDVQRSVGSSPEALLFLVLFGAVLIINELGGLLRGRTRERRFSRRVLLLITGAWYAGIALLIVGWWLGSDLAASALFAVFAVASAFAALTVAQAISSAIRVRGARLGRR